MAEHSVITYNRGDDPESLTYLIEQCDAIVHLAGEMRPSDNNELFTANVGLTEKICSIIKNSTNKKILLLASSIQAEQNNPYGLSKSQAEQAVIKLLDQTENQVIIYRLPHVFGRWCKPNYNSVIATFCYNISRGIPIKINDPDAIIKPVYIDNVVSEFLSAISSPKDGISWGKVLPEYVITIGELANRIEGFNKSKSIFISDISGLDLNTALYLTYISYLETDSF